VDARLYKGGAAGFAGRRRSFGVRGGGAQAVGRGGRDATAGAKRRRVSPTSRMKKGASSFLSDADRRATAPADAG